MTSATFTGLLNRVVTVSRPTLVSTGHGGSAQQLATMSSVRGAIRPTTQAERRDSARADLLDDHRLYLPAATDVQRGDRIAVAGEAETYRVVAVNDPGGRGHHLEVDLRVELDP